MKISQMNTKHALICILLLNASCKKGREDILLMEAQRGLSTAQYELGRVFLSRNDVKVKGEGKIWIEKSAAQKKLEAQLYLGWMYSIGLHVNQDDKMAASWYELAVNNRGSGEMSAECVEMLEDARLFLDGFNNTNTEARLILARRYESIYSNKSGYEDFKGGYADLIKTRHASVRWYLKAAESGNLESQMNLGELYLAENRRGDSLKWFRAAADQGSFEAHHRIGEILLEDKSTHSEAFSHFQTASNLGGLGSNYYVGIMLVKGLGVDEDLSEAARWFRKGAEKQVAVCQYWLARMYMNGHGVSREEIEAREREWNETEVPQALSALKNYTEKKYQKIDAEEAVKWCLKSAEQGYAPAQCWLGEMIRDGKWIASNDIEAVKWFRKAAEQGDGHALYCMGQMILEGRGTPKDENEAQDYFRRAALRNHVEAQYSLGLLLEAGDIIEACVWLNVSSANGNESARNRLNLVYNRLDDSDKKLVSRRAKEIFEELR